MAWGPERSAGDGRDGVGGGKDAIPRDFITQEEGRDSQEDAKIGGRR
jgi:hypothetical protein